MIPAIFDDEAWNVFYHDLDSVERANAFEAVFQICEYEVPFPGDRANLWPHKSESYPGWSHLLPMSGRTIFLPYFLNALPRFDVARIFGHEEFVQFLPPVVYPESDADDMIEDDDE